MRMNIGAAARGLAVALILPLLIGPSIGGAAAPTSAAEVMYSDPFTGFDFPKRIGTYVFQNRIQYDRVRAGYGINYVESSGARATIFIYDLNFTDINDGLEDPRVLEEFHKIEEGTDGLIPPGARGATRNNSIQQLSKAWLQANHDLVDRNGVRFQSYSFIRGQNRRFVKIRVVTPSQGTYARLPIFLLGVSRSIGMMKS